MFFARHSKTVHLFALAFQANRCYSFALFFSATLLLAFAICGASYPFLSSSMLTYPFHCCTCQCQASAFHLIAYLCLCIASLYVTLPWHCLSRSRLSALRHCDAILDFSSPLHLWAIRFFAIAKRFYTAPFHSLFCFGVEDTVCNKRYQLNNNRCSNAAPEIRYVHLNHLLSVRIRLEICALLST